MKPLGGIIHTYQKYDPVAIPGPAGDAPDVASLAMEHMLAYGSLRELTEEELAEAIHLDPSQIAGLGPSLEALRAILEDRKRKILQKYETESVRSLAKSRFHDMAKSVHPPGRISKAFHKAVREEQIADLEDLWYQVETDRGKFPGQLMQLSERLGELYQIEQLASKYAFEGRESLGVPEAIAVKNELEAIDRLLEQLAEAAKTAKIGIIDMDLLAQFTEPGSVEQLSELQQRVQEYLKELASRQGLEHGSRGGFEISPKAVRLFQSRILTTIFSDLQASRSGRHTDHVSGEGAVESVRTKEYEFGDSLTQLDVTASMTNALIRSGHGLPVRMSAEDFVIHRTQVQPKAATAVLLDMSGSMRYGGLYVDVKRMALALDGLIRKEYPGDFVQFVEMFSLARPCHASELATLMPKPVTVFNPVVRLKADMSDPDVVEAQIPPHFTNIQHALRLARRLLVRQNTPNRQVVLITDGLPTAHFEEEVLFLLYPPDPRTEKATLREGLLCAQAGITINIFLLSSWNQSQEDVRFAYRLAESTKGRVIFVGGRDLDRYVVWDYLKRKKSIVA
ncbi:MAG: hypothetical protein K1X57_03300 [Gemmataceae bacterium]|nr:hypothetical protein [Gemmataceae bacterium]